MAKLTRYSQLLFGSSATANEIAKFGSFAAGTPVRYSGTTVTPALIQALSNYLSGWFAAVEGSFSPAIEDMNALCYLFAYQLCYLFQAGVPEWDSGTTYYTGSLASSSGTLYASLTDTNLNHAVTDTTKWFTPVQNGSLTPNALPGTTWSLPASQSMMWPNLQIGSGQTMTVPSSANLIGVTSIVLSGTGVLVATGTGIIRII